VTFRLSPGDSQLFKIFDILFFRLPLATTNPSNRFAKPQLRASARIMDQAQGAESSSLSEDKKFVLHLDFDLALSGDRS